ncbi:MAG: hypothetical protein V3V25_02390 [Paracoccaceae bacterium]
MAYIIEPRFSGGTSTAVAQELRAVAPLVNLRVFGVSSKTFKGDGVAPKLEAALLDLGLSLEWDPPKISADIVVLHNPAFLKFQTELPISIVADHLYVVTHENFLRPGGNPSFDVTSCLDQIDRAVFAKAKVVAPISTYNRDTVAQWFSGEGARVANNWNVLSENWFNICEFELHSPTAKPADRRGRLSRPGFEKFPSIESLEHCFPATAQSNILLGANNYTNSANEFPHWRIFPFQGLEVDEFFREIDFMVYYTSPTWRESFGRVLAEAIAAGKVVISDHGTALNFGKSVVALEPEDVSSVIEKFVNNPESYAKHVRKAQEYLKQFSSSAFEVFFCSQVIPMRQGAL